MQPYRAAPMAPRALTRWSGSLITDPPWRRSGRRATAELNRKQRALREPCTPIDADGNDDVKQ